MFGDLVKTCLATWRKRVAKYVGDLEKTCSAIWRNVFGDLEKACSAIWRKRVR